MFILLFSCFFSILQSCKEKQGVITSKNDKAISNNYSNPKDSVSFEKFELMFKLVATPCSTNIIAIDKQYLLLPFDKNMKYLNGLDESKITDYQKEPQGIPCDYYHNNCSKQFVGNLKDWYYEDVMANKVSGIAIKSNNKNLKIFLCYAKRSESDIRHRYNIYLLVFSSQGELISAIETNCVCSNKVSIIKRKGYIDENLNIWISENQINNECNEGDFEIAYHYKITETGLIVKKDEKVKVYKK